MPSALSTETPVLDDLLCRLADGARRHAVRGAGERAALALETARSVAVVAAPWAEAAVGLKQALEPGGRGGPPGIVPASAVLAEELATGPMATIRLLLITAQALGDVARGGLPRLASLPRVGHPERRGDRLHAGLDDSIEVDVLPAAAPGLRDRTVFGGFRGTVRCSTPGGPAAFERAWRREVESRPAAGGVAVVLGAGNVTGLAPADVISQVFEHGRAVLLKLHPLHGVIEPILRTALGPLVAAGVLEIVTGGVDVARAAVAAAPVSHVHLTGGEAAFDALVWGGPRRDRAASARPVLAKPLTCELGNVTPWVVVPGRYTSRELNDQADMIAGSILNNSSFNCIATKLVITARSWSQRQALLDRVQRRLAAQPARRAWYPGSTALWETLAERRAPADGTLPAIFRPGLDSERDARWWEREWFAPCAGEVALDGDSVDAFCARALELTRRMPGSLAASVTLPATSDPATKRRQEMLVDHLAYGVVAVNCWSALAYALTSIPWGGFPGGTLEEPRSGLGTVHDPLLLPLVHNSIIRGPLAAWPPPPWLPWHTRGAQLTRGLIEMYGRAAAGRSTLLSLLRLLPDVLAG